MGRLADFKTFTQQGFGEFKAFIQRGNVIDLAVAVIIGAAFGKIVTSLVTDIISPPIGLATAWIYGLISDVGLSETNNPVMVHLGRFLQSIVDFLIVAFCVFLLVKAVTTMQKRFTKEDEPKAAELTTQERLLTEIRDLLKTQQAATSLPEPINPEPPKPV